jgi:phosphoglycerate dehydrogenase-like enzyme
MPKVVITAKIAKEGPHNKIFHDHGFDVAYPSTGCDVFQEDQLITVLQGADAVLAGSEPYTPRVIAALPQLRTITRAGVGYDAVNLEACDRANIPVCITPGVNHHSVAEHTIALLMAVARGFPHLDRKVRVGEWSRKSFPRVMGKTLGLVGLGRIGQATATRGVGLGMRVIAHEPYPDRDFCQKWNIELVDLNTVLAQADFLSLHCPSTPESRHLIRKENIEKMKPGAVLINTARGTLVNEADLFEALRSHRLAAAGLDVFEVEPLPLTSPLLTLDNVLVSGHIAGLDDESAHGTSKMCAEIITGLYQGRWPTGCVMNLKGKTGWTW